MGGGPLSFWSCQSPSLRAGKLYLQQQKFDLAIEQLEQAVGEDSTSGEAYYHLGRANGLAGYYVEMVVAFDRSLALSGRFETQIKEERLYYWTRLYNDGVRIASMRQPHLEQARTKFRLATKIIPSRLLAWKNLGITQYSLGEIDEAITTFEHVTLFSRNDTVSLRTLGTLYLQQRRDQDAIEVFERALLQVEQLGTLTNLAVAHTRLGHLDDAEKTYLRALETNQDHWQSHYNLGSLYWQRGRLNDAREAFERAVELNPDDIDARHNLAAAYLGLNLLDEAFPLLEMLVQDMPNNASLWRELARVYDHRGMVEEGRMAYDRATEFGE